MGGPLVVGALALGLAAMLFISLLLLRISVTGLTATVEPSPVRTLKRVPAKVVVRLASGRAAWARVAILSARPRFGIESTSRQVDGSTLEIDLKPLYAGRFRDITVELQIDDVLGLFQITRQVAPVGFALESLPRSLLAPPVLVAVAAPQADQVPAGRRGFGQEIYSVEEYQSGFDSRDILWKRVAASTDNAIPVRVRETNLPDLVKVAVALSWDTDEERTKLLDLAIEVVGAIGKSLTLKGAGLQVAFDSGDGRDTGQARALPQLAELCVRLGDAGPYRASDSGPRRSDIVILGPRELGAGLLEGTAASRAVVVFEGEPPRVGGSAVFYTGREDLSRLAEGVLRS